MTHADRWWATYNAAISDLAAMAISTFGTEALSVERAHDWAKNVADMAHGDLKLTDLGRFERLEETINSADAQCLALDDETDRNTLVRMLSRALFGDRA